VDNLPAMEEVEAAADDFHQFERRIGAHARANLFLQITILEVFHGKVVSLAAGADIVNGNDISVVQRCDYPAFIAESAGVYGGVESSQQFEGNLALQ